jgi:hypothetical protein
MIPPPTGYSPMSVNRQTIQPQGVPGVQGKPVLGHGTTGLGFGASALSGNMLGGNTSGQSTGGQSTNTQALVNALGK